MNAISDTGSIPAFASAEASAIASETTETANRLERALDFASIQPLDRYSGKILQGFAWVLAAVYLVAATALAGATLYYTFVR
jgi:hypothetical protein